MTRPRESWLRSDDPHKWADAMVICRHPAGLCGTDGWCHYGDCFRRPPAPAAESIPALVAEIDRLRDLVNELGQRLDRLGTG